MQRLTRHEHKGKLATPSPGSNPSATETGFILAPLLAALPALPPLPSKALGRWGLFKVRIAPSTPGEIAGGWGQLSGQLKAPLVGGGVGGGVRGSKLANSGREVFTKEVALYTPPLPHAPQIPGTPPGPGKQG